MEIRWQLYALLLPVTRHIRGDNRPFGGIKLIVTGDFLQLPPVGEKNSVVRFCFECEAWNRCIRKTIVLESVHRQDDQRFVIVLEEIRVGLCTNDVCAALAQTKLNNFSSIGIVPTRLCTHTSDALAVNTRYLEELDDISGTVLRADSRAREIDL
ncbi:hypothetical protein KIN20_022804 [Parelaphostrongylus tenuis]|uniref:ATP-dependent DNA helicase n=1 Tax=Parelaphostrongylus tenuis TaxID=148309 RepID=A0AAD5MW05_PARTN|nr:hypothetical protein KIN20_022794 [Parelaphostrongylus tenuis]KAJ1363048.1 hypothetical protein KIN20_022804 [Parelaphostrongylus tenuis]